MSFTKRLGCSSSDPPNHPPSDLAQEFTTKLLAANSNDAALQADLRSTFQTYNWSSTLAAAILSALENAITAGKTMGPAMKSAYEDAVTAVRRVKAWADAHPEMAAVVVTFIALGILAVMVPWVVGYLGFAEEGIVQGSWAAGWQARYRGFVPKGSLFSYLQRLVTKIGWGWRGRVKL